MNSSDLNSQNDELIEIQCCDRWSAYQRLQELGIPCWCSYYQPLQVQIRSVAAAIQIWSVFRQMKVSRPVLIDHLECCWQVCKVPDNE